MSAPAPIVYVVEDDQALRSLIIALAQSIGVATRDFPSAHRSRVMDKRGRARLHSSFAWHKRNCMKHHSKLWIAVFACVITGLAHAHAHLERSTPADGSTLNAVPEALEMRFSEPARLTALWIQHDQEPRQAVKGLPTSMDRALRVGLPALAPGVYSIAWRAVSADGHITSGTLRFTVAPGVR